MTSATQGSSGPSPSSAPGRPTLVRPVRIGDWPVMKAARSCRAALLAVPVGKDCAFSTNTVDVGRAVAHDPHVVGADIKPTDVIAHDEQDVWLAPSRCRLRLRDRDWRACVDCARRGERRATKQNAAPIDGGRLPSIFLFTHSRLPFLQHTESRHGSWTYPPAPHGALPGGSGDNSWARTGASRL